MSAGLLSGLVTALLLVVFLGGVAWAGFIQHTGHNELATNMLQQWSPRFATIRILDIIEIGIAILIIVLTRGRLGAPPTQAARASEEQPLGAPFDETTAAASSAP